MMAMLLSLMVVSDEVGPEMRNNQQTCKAVRNTKCKPFSRNASFLGTQNVDRSSENICERITKCEPSGRNTESLGTQNANHSAEMHHAWEHKT